MATKSMQSDPLLSGTAKQIYEAVCEEVAQGVGSALKDSLSDLEVKLKEMVVREIDQRIKYLISSHEVKMLDSRDEYVKNLEVMIKAMHTPVINIVPSKKTRTEKSVIYGPTGRPDKIVEETCVEITEDKDEGDK